MSNPFYTITVECPHCGKHFETNALGDVCGCIGCGESFNRFTNIVGDAR